jgi:hypothetical protein
VGTNYLWHETKIKITQRKLGAIRVWERKVTWRWLKECKSKKKKVHRQLRQVKSFNPYKLSRLLFSKYRNFTSYADNIITTLWHIRKECPFVDEEPLKQNLQWVLTFFLFLVIKQHQLTTCGNIYVHNMTNSSCPYLHLFLQDQTSKRRRRNYYH